MPYGITIDQATLDDNTATLRERDSMAQVRLELCHPHLGLSWQVMSGGHLLYAP